MSPNVASPALQAATIFLTRPLVLFGIQSPSTLVALSLYLQSAMAAHTKSPQLLSFAPTCLPPLPIQLACVAFGIKWTAWIQALGGAAFDLVIEPTRVYVVKKSNGQVGIIWISKDAPTFASVPQVPMTQDVDSESEAEVSDVEFDSQSSRPSSRSSTVSDSAFSFTSRSSASSQTSASSISSLPKPSITKLAPTPAPVLQSNPTKYLYQGGVSTVLTGGVMLGGGAARPRSTPSTPPAPVAPAPAAPRIVAAPVYTPPHRTRTQGTTPSVRKSSAAPSAATSSWRRGPATIRVSV
ncbi:hypothetical protein FPV67DRAFT_1514206 [Lyophyllum atratum]|nr:hypothetical protein FPV67DRAFT_1514206 [Lyophyllum atratum]